MFCLKLLYTYIYPPSVADDVSRYSWLFVWRLLCNFINVYLCCSVSISENLVEKSVVGGLVIL